MELGTAQAQGDKNASIWRDRGQCVREITGKTESNKRAKCRPGPRVMGNSFRDLGVKEENEREQQERKQLWDTFLCAQRGCATQTVADCIRSPAKARCCRSQHLARRKRSVTATLGVRGILAGTRGTTGEPAPETVRMFS